MKRLTHLSCALMLMLIALTCYACRSSSYPTKGGSSETKKIGVEKEVTASKTEDTAVNKEVGEVKKEEKAAEPSPVAMEADPEIEPLSRNNWKASGKTFNGGASYYADHFHGKRTASGALYDRKKNTAAIRTNALPFPFGTMLEVTSIKTGKSVVVQVNDKMSDKAKGIIDLSYEAANAIGLILDGRTEVTIRVITEEDH
jgi:rare lipoprotein A